MKFSPWEVYRIFCQFGLGENVHNVSTSDWEHQWENNNHSPYNVTLAEAGD